MQGSDPQEILSDLTIEAQTDADLGGLRWSYHVFGWLHLSALLMIGGIYVGGILLLGDSTLVSLAAIGLFGWAVGDLSANGRQHVLIASDHLLIETGYRRWRWGSRRIPVNSIEDVTGTKDQGVLKLRQSDGTSHRIGGLVTQENVDIVRRWLLAATNK